MLKGGADLRDRGATQMRGMQFTSSSMRNQISQPWGIVTAILVALSSANQVTAQPSDPLFCPQPPAPQPHPMGSFDFDTESRLDSSGNMPLFYDCVHNNDATHSLHVNWYVTSLQDVWVPKHLSLDDPRPLDGDPAGARIYNSCIEYDGAGQATVAYFMNTQPQPADVLTQHPNCPPAQGEAAAAAAPPSAQPTKSSYPIHLFFPTDRANPEGSLLDLNGYVEFTESTATKYTPIVQYDVARFDKAEKGRLDQVLVQIVFRGAAEGAALFFNRVYKDGPVPLVVEGSEKSAFGKGYLAFPISSTVGWHMGAGVLQFTNRDHQELAAILLPLFIPGK